MMAGDGTSRAVGILGGTFDPVHRAHLHLAEKAQQCFHLQQVFFLVARYPPHKPLRLLTGALHRYAMTALALETYPQFLALPIEFEMEGTQSNYTCDTLDAFCRRQQLAPRQVYFLAGGDSFRAIHTWKNFQELLLQYNFVFIERPGSSIGTDFSFLPEVVRQQIVDFRVNPKARVSDSPAIYLLETKAPPISSTEIREKICRGEDACSEVSPNVYEYIRKYRLYL